MTDTTDDTATFVPPANVAIRASAGAGKTFALTKRYLELLFKGVPPERILATTFTRKAAGEILARIVGRLAEAVLNPVARNQLAADLSLPTLGKEEIEKQLASLVDRLSRTKIGTLDRFFSVAARSLSLDLGLPAGWTVLDLSDDARLRELAVGDVLTEDTGKDLAQLSRLLSKGEVHRGIYRQIDELVTDLHEVLADTTKDAWDALPRSAELAVPELAAYLDAIEQFPLESWPVLFKARQKDIENARLGNWMDFVSKGLGKAVASGSPTYSRVAIPDGIQRAYEEVAQHASAVLRNRLVTQNRATHDLLLKYDRHYRDKQFRTGGIRFSDVTRVLADAVPLGMDVWTGGSAGIEHLLLDEFQDTSTLQWRVIAPLARRCAAAREGSFFCVGDPKQAIYRWRGGVAELFDVLGQDIAPLDWQNLVQSYRSSPVVIDVVNQVFGTLATNEVFANDPFLHGVATKWSERFQPHRAARTERPGYVRLVVGPEEDEDDEEESDILLRFTADEILHLHDQSPGATIGVLVRENRAVARMLSELRRLGLEASEEGGNPLTRSPAVSLILSFLDWLDHPGNSASLFHVTRSPLGDRLGLLPNSSLEKLSAIAQQWRRDFIELGYAETIRRLVDTLQPGLPRSSQSKLEQLLELAINYSSRSTLRPSDFVHYVEETKVDDPSTASLRVMTVHQAKGLEFDIVVLPELDKLLRGQPPRFVVGRENPTSPIDAICRYTNTDEQALLPEKFRKMFDDHRHAVLVESLCLLYVAMTRPIHALHMIIKPAKANEKKLPATFAGVVRAALARSIPAKETAVLFEAGDPNWSDRMSREEVPTLLPSVPLEKIRWKTS